MLAITIAARALAEGTAVTGFNVMAPDLELAKLPVPSVEVLTVSALDLVQVTAVVRA